MFEKILSGLKVTLLMMLFVAPLAAAEWNRQLDQWMQQNHRWAPLTPHYIPQEDDAALAADMDSLTPDFLEVDNQIREEAW